MQAAAAAKDETTSEALTTTPIGFLRAAENANLPDYKKWHVAMVQKHESLMQHKVWVVVDRANCKVLRTRWVLAVKGHERNQQYKARFVALGCSQVEGVDIFSTFSPTLSKDTLRTMLTIAVMENMVLRQLDVSTAFLHGAIDQETFVELLELLSSPSHRARKVGSLKKALYGLLEAPRLWANTFATSLLDSGYRRCTQEPCLFARQVGTKITMLCVYVDDIIIAASEAATLRETVDLLRTKYQMKDLCAQSEILGWEIHVVENGLLLNQSKFVGRILLLCLHFCVLTEKASYCMLAIWKIISKAAHD
jgi:Reverse transcriptase (RNA-dependent DNA polymerase)